jgi:hypothetical protein
MTFMLTVLLFAYFLWSTVSIAFLNIFICVDPHWIALFYREESPQDAVLKTCSLRQAGRANH